MLNDETPERIVSILLASSALPFVFSYEKLGKYKYLDGGIPLLGDNVPIQPLYDAGFRKFIVVHLGEDAIGSNKEFDGAECVHILPSNNMGKVARGTLNFSPEKVKERIDMGYFDTKKLFFDFRQ